MKNINNLRNWNKNAKDMPLDKSLDYLEDAFYYLEPTSYASDHLWVYAHVNGGDSVRVNRNSGMDYPYNCRKEIYEWIDNIRKQGKKWNIGVKVHRGTDVSFGCKIVDWHISIELNEAS